jgi:hypothetical protein
VDLWLIFDDLYKEAKGQLPVPIALRWLKGHAGNTFNEVADKLATLAAWTSIRPVMAGSGLHRRRQAGRCRVGLAWFTVGLWSVRRSRLDE